MKRFTLFLLAIIFGGLACSQSTNEKKMPITTDSETALKLYYEAWDAVFDYRMDEAMQLWSDALQADSEFFMANYMYANLNSSDSIKYKQYSEKAMNCNAKLSEGELLIKDALTKILENPKSDVTDLGKKLVELYPKDVFTYIEYSAYQARINDVDGRIVTLISAIKVAEKPDIIYNTLGYAYMRDGRYEEAEVAFDKYIELAPNHPNPYDSKGEYFETIKDYQNAAESYMKAYELDSKEWRLKRAEKAKSMADSLLNRK